MSVNAVLNYFKPAPHLPEIQDGGVVKNEYAYWRIRIFYSIYIGYIFYYFGRKSFTSITPFMINDLGLSKSEVGLIATILSITYGISKFASGMLCDRSNPRYFMAFGLIISGLCNIFFGFSSSFWALAIFWGINGLFQGWGWPSCTKQLTHWYSRSERGRWWSSCTTSQTVGGFLGTFVAVFPASWFGWRWGMYIPAIMCLVSGVWLLNRLRDEPQSLGLPSIEKYKGEIQEPNSEKLMPIKKILFEQVLNNKYVWILSISYFFVYVVRQAIHDWGNLYLVETRGLTAVQAGFCVSCFEVGGFLGMLVAGWGSDRWFNGKRVPLMVLYALVLVIAVLGLWYINPGELVIPSLLFCIIGFLVFGPQMLVGLAVAEFVSKKAASTSNGFAGCFAYLGAAAAGYPILWISEIYGWWGFIVTLVLCSAITSIILMPIWGLKGGMKGSEEQAAEEPTTEFGSGGAGGLRHSTSSAR